MTVMIGPQSRRSSFEGVIQFNTMLKAFTVTAIHIVQNGQFGQPPSAESTASAIPTKRKMEAAATSRPEIGRGPST